MGSLSEAFRRSCGLNPAGGSRVSPHPSLGQPRSWRGRWENPNPDPRNLCGAAFPGSCSVLWEQRVREGEGAARDGVRGCPGAPRDGASRWHRGPRRRGARAEAEHVGYGAPPFGFVRRSPLSPPHPGCPDVVRGCFRGWGGAVGWDTEAAGGGEVAFPALLFACGPPRASVSLLWEDRGPGTTPCGSLPAASAGARGCPGAVSPPGGLSGRAGLTGPPQVQPPPRVPRGVPAPASCAGRSPAVPGGAGAG